MIGTSWAPGTSGHLASLVELSVAHLAQVLGQYHCTSSILWVLCYNVGILTDLYSIASRYIFAWTPTLPFPGWHQLPGVNCIKFDVMTLEDSFHDSLV